MQPVIEPFFDPATSTYTYVVSDPDSRAAAILDSVLDYDPASGRLSTESADQVIAYLDEQQLQLQWILETHVHADHLTASTYLKAKRGGQIGIGSQVSRVQQTFGALFNAEPGFAQDGSQFDRLFEDDDTINIGQFECRIWHTPGHTPACVTYVFDRAAFVADFPGGDAATLYRSVKRILALPEDTELYMCHDYETDERAEFCHVTTVMEERAANIHVADGVSEAEFVTFRTERDKVLAAPRLLLPSVQFNMRAGRLAPPEGNGQHYMKIPARMDENLSASLAETLADQAA